jgi:hypothetical protein
MRWIAIKIHTGFLPMGIARKRRCIFPLRTTLRLWHTGQRMASGFISTVKLICPFPYEVLR